ncbi:fimbrial protein [Escherichia coli]|nr:fimbrial protein [Escherichia coli]
MKKTLIALAVAASAAVSGSAMAWTQNGAGGSVDLGGTLTPVDVITPWEIKTGAGVGNLNASIKKQQNSVEVASSSVIEILGIRTKDKAAFAGEVGISPQISYGGAIVPSAFSNGETDLTLEVRNSSDSRIGSLTTSLFAQGYASEKQDGVAKKYFVFSAQSGDAFYGGLGESASAISTTDLASSYMPDVEANWVNQSGTLVEPEYANFNVPSKTYNGYYFSVIKPGQKMRITLDTPATGDDQIEWKASLPVTVSYQ